MVNKMKKTLKTTLAALALLASCDTLADSTNLSVIGEFSPAACEPVLSDNGVVDYGDISVSTLKADALNLLSHKEVTLNISCTGPIKVSLVATSQRKGTTLGAGNESATGAMMPLNSSQTPLYAGVVGLGMDGENKIGAYGIIIKDIIMDGIKASPIESKNNNTWSERHATSLYHEHAKSYISWRNNANVAPGSFENMSAILSIRAYLNKTSELDVSKPIKLDGATSIEMLYL